MKSYLLLHYGFERPTPEEMGEWNSWFESIADKQVDRGGFRGGREIAQGCPIVASTRVYEVMNK